MDDDELATDTEIIRTAAREAIGTETNILRKIFKIRNIGDLAINHIKFTILKELQPTGERSMMEDK